MTPRLTHLGKLLDKHMRWRALADELYQQMLREAGLCFWTLHPDKRRVRDAAWAKAGPLK